jgi:LysM repeat protein
MATAFTSAGQGLVQARLEIVAPTVPNPIIPLKFNPTEYQLQKSNNFAEISIPGLESPPIQFVRGAAEKLSVELLVDTSDTLEDVRLKYVNALRDLMRIQIELHAPPIVRLVWDSEIFKGVLESLNITYVLFTPQGIPLRAKLSVSLKEYRPVDIQVKESPKASPDQEKSYTVQRGETLSSIAELVYKDPEQWRAIASANGILDPRYVAAGTRLTLPQLV